MVHPDHPAHTDLLIVFVRHYQAGRVKTRLIKRFGAQGALSLYKQLVANTFAAAAHFPGDVRVLMDAEDHEISRGAVANGWQTGLQSSGDLGQRMVNAMKQGLQHYHRVLLVGSDCPVLSLDYFHKALNALSEHPVIFGPSRDGGYVLIGGSQWNDWHVGRFDEVRLGTPCALEDSIAAFAPHQVFLLSPLWDVDEPQDVFHAVENGLLVIP